MAIDSTTTPGMRKTGAEFVRGYNENVRTKNALHADLENILTHFTGRGGNAFRTTMFVWGKRYDEIMQHLDAMCDLLLGGAGHIEKADDFALHQGQFFNEGAEKHN